METRVTQLAVELLQFARATKQAKHASEHGISLILADARWLYR